VSNTAVTNGLLQKEAGERTVVIRLEFEHLDELEEIVLELSVGKLLKVLHSVTSHIQISVSCVQKLKTIQDETELVGNWVIRVKCLEVVDGIANGPFVEKSVHLLDRNAIRLWD